MTELRTIGEAARETGVPAKTLRYYESIDLVPASDRAANGYRLYGERAIHELHFVKRARDLGFSVEDVRRLLALWRDPSRSSGEVRELARQHAAAIERKIQELQALRATLEDLVSRCHGSDRPDCPILQDLAKGA